MKKPPSIDTLRYAQTLEDAGMDRGAANAMAQVLNEELVDRLLTKADVAEALEPINAKLADLAQAFEPIHAKLAEIDQRFEGVDAKFEAVDAKFDAMDAKFDAMDTKFEALDAKIDTKVDALDVKFNSLSTKVVFGFSMVFLVLSSLVALGVFQIVRSTPSVPVAVERPAESSKVAGEAAPDLGDLKTPDATWRGSGGLR